MMIAAERRKAWSTRTTFLLAVGAVAVVAVGTFSTVRPTGGEHLTAPLHDQTFFLLASVNLSLFALLVGVRSSTDEYRHGTIGWTLLSTNRRGRFVGAKATVAALHAAAIVAVAVGTGIAIALAVGTRQGGTVDFGTADAVATAGMVVAGALWGAIGVGVGTLVRHQVAAVITVMVWVLVLENLGPTLLGSGSRFLPGQAAHALASVDLSTDLLPRGIAVLVLAAYAAVSCLAGAFTLSRRPVPTS